MTRSLRRTAKAKPDPEGRMSVLDHLRELRRRLIVVMIIIALGAIVGWLVYNPLLAILKQPYCNIPYQHRLGAQNQSGSQCKLLFRAPLDGFTIRLKSNGGTSRSFSSFTLWITDKLVPPFEVEGFWTYIGSVIVIWLVNWMVYGIFRPDRRESQHELTA